MGTSEFKKDIPTFFPLLPPVLFHSASIYNTRWLNGNHPLIQFPKPLFGWGSRGAGGYIWALGEWKSTLWWKQNVSKSYVLSITVDSRLDITFPQQHLDKNLVEGCCSFMGDTTLYKDIFILSLFFTLHLWRLFVSLMYENTDMHANLSCYSFNLHYITVYSEMEKLLFIHNNILFNKLIN